MTIKSRSLIIGTSLLALAACGPEEISSPGGGSITIINNNNTGGGGGGTPTPTPGTPTPTGSVTAAANCPTIADPAGLTDSGVLTVPHGTVRVCTLPDRFTASSTLLYVSGVAYRMRGRVDIGEDGGPAPDGSDGAQDTNVTLSVEPGVVIFGASSDAVGTPYMVVNRGNRINAQGSSTQPIIFTSEANVLGTTTNDDSGQWGGLIVLGRAPVTDCLASGATPGTVDCQRDTEGSPDPALYGGATDNDNSGTLRYVQLRYSGAVLSADAELQSLTTGGTGSATVFDHIMSYNSSDDAVEFFGGHVNAKHLVLVGAEDDNLDTDTGVKANLQYVIVVQRQGVGNSIIEADSNNDRIGNVPRQNTQVSNATFISRNTGDGQAMQLRGGTDYALVNSVVHAPGQNCLRIRLPETMQAADASADENGPPVFNSVVMRCDTPFVEGEGATVAEIQALFDAGTNNNFAFTTTLSDLFINGSNESAVPAFGASVLSSFFDNAGYIGAVRDANDTWYRGWTCDSATANFGSGKSCTASPVT